MKKFICSAIISSMFLLNSCLSEFIGSGPMSSQPRTVSSFTAINVESAFEVYLTQGDTDQLTIEAHNDVLPYIKSDVNGGVLHIYVDRSVWNSMRHPNNDLKAYITLRSLSGLEASGACDVRGSGTFPAENLDINLSGASKIDLTVDVTGNINCDASGASDITLKGTANTFKTMTLSGASTVSAFGLATQSITMDLSGASDVEVSTNEMSITASGASKIKYTGSPVIIYQDLSGASEIKHQ